VLNERVHSGHQFNRHLGLLHAGRQWVVRVAYTVVRLVMHDCIRGLSTRYPTVDSMMDVGSTSASVEY